MGDLCAVRVSPTYTSTELFAPHSHTTRPTLPTISKFVRPAQNRLNLWGTVNVSYGGIGRAAIEQKYATNCCTSRNHGHFGTGCINSDAAEQPYRLTSLLLSKCRPTDQLLPLPLMSNLIHERKLKCPCPKNSTSLYSSDVTPQERQNVSSYYSSTYRRDYRNYWNSEHNPENTQRSIISNCSDDADQIVNDDTASVAEEADRVNEVTIEMVDNQKEMESKDMATQTDIDLAAIVCAWERSYDPKNKKDYTCSPLQLEESSSTKHINDEDESSPTLDKAVQTLPMVHFPLVQRSKALSFSQLPTSRSPLKLPELSDAVCQTTDVETHRNTNISQKFNLKMVTAKPQVPPCKMNWKSYNLQRLNNTLHSETVPSFSLTRREGKRQYFCGYHSSVFRG